MAVELGGTPTGTTGTGVSGLSVSHTAAGTERAVWIGGGCSAASPPTVSTATYGGIATSSAYLNLLSGTFFRSRGFWIVGDGTISTTALTAAVTYSASADEAVMSVISLRGVDGTTPVGAAVTSVTAGATPSVTVASVGADDMVVDFVYAGDGPTTGSSGPGANQTLGTEGNAGSGPVYGGASYQDGADGGVMSWTLTTTPGGVTLGALAFKPSAGGAPEAIRIRFQVVMDGIGGGVVGGSRVY